VREEIMDQRTKFLAGAAAATLWLVGVPSVASAGAQPAVANSFGQTNLVANSSSAGAKLVDPNLTNAWGFASSDGGPIWVSDNNSGDASVYSGGVGGGSVTLDLTVPVPGGNPTGQVANPTLSMPKADQAFPVGGKSGPAADFIVSTDSIGATQSPGEIAAWDGGSSFVVEDSPSGGAGGHTPAGAVFKGLAVADAPKVGPELYAADVANATVDVFNRNFKLMSTPSEFKDPALPKGYAPFGIQLLDGKLYVTYGRQNAAKTDVVAGAGLGVVDEYDPSGVLVAHLISNGSSSPLDEPWGLTLAPTGFGPFAGMLLVGNLGNGWINAFNPTTGAFRGTLDDTSGYPITIPGLWGLRVGNSSFGGSTAVVFSAGPGGYADGLLGILTPADAT
jgi:uncharacterized protein (TIGR03118 family)